MDVQPKQSCMPLDWVENGGRDWQQRAGKRFETVHKAKVEQGLIDLIHVQADEIWVKMRGMVVWVGLAIMVSTRLWIPRGKQKKR